jgi:hypothetical protein
LTIQALYVIIQSEREKKEIKKMTVNELIAELQKIVDNGHGDRIIQNDEADDIYSILDDDRYTKKVTIYFE